MADKNTLESKITILTAVICVIIAIIGDLISLVPYVNIISGFMFWLGFILFFWFKGVKKIGPNTVAAIIETIPILSMIPGITVGVMFTIGMQWVGEKKARKKEKHDAESKVKGGKTATPKYKSGPLKAPNK